MEKMKILLYETSWIYNKFKMHIYMIIDRDKYDKGEHEDAKYRVKIETKRKIYGFSFEA